MEQDLLIIGAGPAGLACAIELARAGRPATIIEKDEQVGGLAQTLVFHEGRHCFRTDIGPHRFFSKNRFLYDFIEDLIAEQWRLVPRRTRQFVDGKFYDYPINARQALANFGPRRSFRVAADFLAATARYRLGRRPIRTFEDYIVAHFGRALAEFSMINYTEKIWGIAAAEIHPDWARQRIRGLDLVSVARRALWPARRHDGPASLVDQFYYPQYGTGLIYTTIADRLRARGSAIYTGSQPTRINHDGRRITAVTVDRQGESVTYRPEHLVESIPITQFLALLDPPPPPAVRAAAAALRWRAQVYLFITLDRPQVTADNWIYFPDKSIPFGRVSEMKNFSADMAPPDKTSLLIEFFTFMDDAIWRASTAELLDLALPFFLNHGFFARGEIRHSYRLQRQHVYPVYDLTYQRHLGTIRNYLDQFKNLTYLGRPGRFRYTNQDHSLEMGFLAAKGIVDGRPFDLDRVGQENEYYEDGPIYEKRI